MLTVLENAYLKKSQENPNHSNTHEKILYLLLHEKKYYTKDELYCTSNYNQTKLDNALKDLEKQGLITTEGWLVRIAEMGETLMEETIVQRKKK